MTNIHRPLTLVAIASFAFACGGLDSASSDEAPEIADAAFAITTSNDCVDAFANKPFLARLADRRGWGAEEIAAFCAELSEVADVYVEDSTLTMLTVAGGGQLAGETLQAAYFVGVAGYDLTQIRDWLGQVRASRAVRPCTRDAAHIVEAGGPMPDAFMRTCLETETGAAYPAPIFKETRSSVGLDGVGEAAAGLAATVLVYHLPGTGTVAAFVAGTFYAQADPAYGAFVGCGAAAGFDAVAETGAASYICVAGEY